jgi:hypothetical protein
MKQSIFEDDDIEEIYTPGTIDQKPAKVEKVQSKEDSEEEY